MKLVRLIANNVFKYNTIDITFDNATYLILASTKDKRKEINVNTGLEEEIIFDNYEKSNGVGKSAIIETIVYGLFGQTLRGINDISKYHKGRFYIELHFEDGLKIIRHDKGIEIVDKEGKKQLLKKTEGQQIINSIIKLDLDMLTYTNIFTPENNFFKLSDVEKKDILMRLINIEWIDDSYEKVKDDLDSIISKRMDTIMDIYENDIKNIGEAEKKEEVSRKELLEICKYEKGLREWIDFNKQMKMDVENYRRIYNDNKSLYKSTKALQTKIAETKYEDVEGLRTILSDLKVKRSTNNNKINEFQDKINKVSKVSHCPVFVDFECEKVNNAEYKRGLIDGYNKIISELNVDNIVLEKQISDLDNKISTNIRIKQQLDEDKADFESGKRTYLKVKEELKVKSTKNKEYISTNRHLFQYKHIKIVLEDIKIKQMEHASALANLKVLSDKRDKLSEFKIKNEQIKKDISDLEFIKKFFGKDGMKQFAVSKIVKFLEDEINIMLSDRFDNITVKVETSFDVGKRNSLKIIVNRMGNSVDWNEFSAGERRILEIIFQVAMNKLYQNFSNQRFNVYFMDEIFDVLDRDNTNVATNLLALLKGDNDTVFVVSHNPDIQYLFNNKLYLSADLENKNSCIVE